MRLFLSTLKFAAGFVANLTTQTARSAANAAGCALALAAGILYALVALLQMLGGGTTKARSSASSSWSSLRASLKMGFASVAQAVGTATLLSPLARAAQACSEGMTPRGVFTPAGEGRNFWQHLFGMNSWTEPAKKEPPLPTEQKKPAAKQEAPVKKAKSKQNPPAIRQLPAKKNRTDDLWAAAVEKYIKAKTVEDSRRILAKMATEFPAQYAKALEAASRPKKSARRAA